jgi:hypothetical protein
MDHFRFLAPVYDRLAETLCGMRSRFFTAGEIGRLLADCGLVARIRRGRRLTTWVMADT